MSSSDTAQHLLHAPIARSYIVVNSRQCRLNENVPDSGAAVVAAKLIIYEVTPNICFIPQASIRWQLLAKLLQEVWRGCKRQTTCDTPHSIACSADLLGHEQATQRLLREHVGFIAPYLCRLYRQHTGYLPTTT